MSVAELNLLPARSLDAASLYRSIFERASDAIAIIAPDGRYVEQNEAHARLLGWTTAELRGSTPAIHIGEAAFAQIRDRLARDGYFLGTVESRDRNGHVRVLELSAFAVTDERGAVVAFVGAKRDISQRIAAEQELRRRYEQLQAIYRMTTSLASATSLEEIFREGLNCTCDALDARRGSILLYDEHGVMRFRAWRELSDQYRAAVEGHSPWAADDPDPQPIVVPDVLLDAALQPLAGTVLREGIRALAFIPLVASRRLLGKFMVYFDSPRELRAEELRLATTIAGHVGFAIARRRAQDELARREREFEALAEHSPDIIARYDRTLRHLYVNPAVETITGHPPATYVGRTVAELPFARELSHSWTTVLQRVFATGEPADVEFAWSTPGGIRHFQARLTPEVVADDLVQTVLSTTRDITDIKHAEGRLRLLAEITGDIVARLDYRDGLSAVAEHMVRSPFADVCIIDLTKADGMLERLTVACLDPAVAAIVRDLDTRFPTAPEAQLGYATAFRTGSAQLYPEITNDMLKAAAHDGEHYALLKSLGVRAMISAPLIARGRTIGLITLVATDERRSFTVADLAFAEELAARLAVAVDNLRLLEDAQAANRIKSDFMATMSHELRTPLNAIMGYTELLDLQIAGPLEPRQLEQLQRIRASTDHLLTVIEQILTFSRVEAGKETLHVEPLRAQDVVAECAAMVEPIARQKGLAFATELPDADVFVAADAVKLRQVLLNMLSNAVKFTDAGHVAIRLRTNGRFAMFEVEDTGIGIAHDHLERVFEPFWQVHSGVSRRAGGTGLGLTVSRQLISLLHGELTVKSELGRGSLFAARVPLAGVTRRGRASGRGSR